jgi:GT2 family glycosyltransferase
MKVSFIFVNFNSTPVLIEAIRSIRTHPPSAPYEIIVVDNASKEDPRAALEEHFPEVRSMRNPWNMGLGRAVNLGIESSSGEYVVAANPDIVVLPGALDALVSFMDGRPDAGAVVPQTFYPNMSYQSNVRRFHRPRFLLFGRKSLLTRLWPGNPFTRDYMSMEYESAREPVEIEVGVGNLLFLRRTAIDRVGAFDPDYFLFSEDTDLCYRLHLDGWKTYLHPGARIVHAHGLSRRHASQLSHHHRRKSVVLFLCKHHLVPSPLCPVLKFALIMADAASAMASLFGLAARESTWTASER